MSPEEALRYKAELLKQASLSVFQYIKEKNDIYRALEKDPHHCAAQYLSLVDLFDTKYWKAWEKWYYTQLPRPKPSPVRIRQRGWVKKTDWGLLFRFIAKDPKFKDDRMLFTDKTEKDLIKELAKETHLRQQYEDILRTYNLLPDD